MDWVNFTAVILKFEKKGEKSGWSYVDVPHEVANRIKVAERKSFRVRGIIDGQAFAGMALVPMGEGDFILPINGSMRKQLKKEAGDVLVLDLEEDKDFRIDVPEDLETCLLEEEALLMERFIALAPSHRNYFIKYINEAKTEMTRTKRIAMTIEAMALGLDFGAMIRLNKSRRTP